MADRIVTPEEAIARAKSKFDEAVDLTADIAMGSIKDLTPVLTGRLQGSWIKEETPDGIDVVNRQPYVKVIEYGQKARERKLITRGKNKGKYKVARSQQEPNYMVTHTTNNAKRIAEIVAAELRDM